MAENIQKKPKVTEYYCDEDQFSPGNACCPGCLMELNLRLVSKIMGKETILLGTPGCSAPTLHGQNDRAWHKHSYYANVMTGVASSASGLSRYYKKAGIDATILCHTGDFSYNSFHSPFHIFPGGLSQFHIHIEGFIIPFGV